MEPCFSRKALSIRAARASMLSGYVIRNPQHPGSYFRARRCGRQMSAGFGIFRASPRRVSNHSKLLLGGRISETRIRNGEIRNGEPPG